MEKWRKRDRTPALFVVVLILIAIASVCTGKVYAAEGSGNAARGGARAENYRSAHGHYSTWEHMNKAFWVPNEYANGIQQTSKKLDGRTPTYSAFGESFQGDKIHGALDRIAGDARDGKLDQRVRTSYVWRSPEKIVGFNLEKIRKGEAGVRIGNLKIYNNREKKFDYIDMKITIMNWTEPNVERSMKYVFISRHAMPHTFVYGTGDLDLKYEFFRAGTDTKYPISSNLTFGDIDAGQTVTFRGAKAPAYLCVAHDTNLDFAASEESVTFGQGTRNWEEHDNDPKDACGFYFKDESAFRLRFGTSRGGSGYWSYYFINAYGMADLEPNEPYKRVSDSDEENVTGNRLLRPDEVYTIDVSHQVGAGYAPSTYFDQYVLSDELEDVLQPVDAVVLQDGVNSSGFRIAVDGQKVTAAAMDGALDNADFYDHLYTLRIRVKINTDKYPTQESLRTLTSRYGEKKPLLSEDGLTLRMLDQGELKVHTRTGHTYRKTTNETVTEVGLPGAEDGPKNPGILVTKSAEPYEFQVGDHIPYRVTFTQKNPKAEAYRVRVKDTDFPNGFRIDPESLSVSGASGKYEVAVTENGNGFEYRADHLKYGETVTLTFTGTADRTLNGTVMKNTVTAGAWGVPEKTASETVYINSPKMHVTKQASKTTGDPSGKYSTGDTISYTAEITQINGGCFMRDICAADTIETKGVSLQKGSVEAEDENGRSMEKGKDYELKYDYDKEGALKGFTVRFLGEYRNMGGPDGTIPATEDPRGRTAAYRTKTDYENLALKRRITLSYSVVVDDEKLGGDVVKNRITVPATLNTNGDLIRDDDKIPSGGDSDENTAGIKGPVLKITKSSDKGIYHPGDTAMYTLELRQIRDNVLAKNVTFTDQFDSKAGVYDLSKARVTMEDQDITRDCSFRKNEEENGFRLETHHDLPFGVTMRVTYPVKIPENAGKGEKLRNVIIGASDNGEPVKTDHTVTVDVPDPAPGKEDPKPNGNDPAGNPDKPGQNQPGKQDNPAQDNPPQNQTVKPDNPAPDQAKKPDKSKEETVEKTKTQKSRDDGKGPLVQTGDRFDMRRHVLIISGAAVVLMLVCMLAFREKRRTSKRK